MSERIEVPHSIALVYREVGETHVFSSKGITGLVHVGSHDRKQAFDGVLEALNTHVSHAYGCEARYSCDVSYETFAKLMDGGSDISANFLQVTLDQAA